MRSRKATTPDSERRAAPAPKRGSATAPPQLLLFCLVGASGLAVDLAGYLALQWLGAEHRLARALSLAPAITWTWWWHRHTTFADRARTARMRQWTRYAMSSLLGAATSWGSYTVLTTWIDHFAHAPLQAFLCAAALALLVNYRFSDKLVYTTR